MSSSLQEATTEATQKPDLRLSGDVQLTTRYVDVPRFSRWTFTADSIKHWVEYHCEGRVLNACCGKTHLNHDDEIIRNDINTNREADLHVDVGELSAHFAESSFDTIVFDPPWSLYQANLRYDGNHVRKNADEHDIDIDLSTLPIGTPSDKQQLGHARLAKDTFNYLLAANGRVIQLTFHGACMPSRHGYDRIERAVFDPIGEAKAVIGSVDVNDKQSIDANE